MNAELEARFVKARCERGLHVTIPIVREHVGDLLYPAICCDRLFAVSFNMATRVLQLIELRVDVDELRRLRGPLDGEAVADDADSGSGGAA